MGNLLSSITNPPGSGGGAAAQQLRSRAQEAARLRGDAFQQSRAAYARGDHAAAKQWSARGKAQGERMAALNQEAAELVFKGA